MNSDDYKATTYESTMGCLLPYVKEVSSTGNQMYCFIMFIASCQGSICMSIE